MVLKWHIQFLKNTMETAKMNNMGWQRVSSCILISGCFRYVVSTALPGLNQELDSLYMVPRERKPSGCIWKCLKNSYLRNSDSVSEKITANDSIMLMQCNIIKPFFKENVASSLVICILFWIPGFAWSELGHF